MKAALTAVVTAPDLPVEALADRVESLLLDIVLVHAPSPIAYAAALMGLAAHDEAAPGGARGVVASRACSQALRRRRCRPR